MKTVVADTSALYALADRDDAHHHDAVKFLHSEGAQLTLLVSDFTLFELLTLVSNRLGHGAALRPLTAISESPRFHLIRMTDSDYQEALRILEAYRDKDWSPFDCACLAVARNYGISESFAFDKHFRQMAAAGLLTLPSSNSA